MHLPSELYTAGELQILVPPAERAVVVRCEVRGTGIVYIGISL